jgi:hypothetical protein
MRNITFSNVSHLFRPLVRAAEVMRRMVSPAIYRHQKAANGTIRRQTAPKKRRSNVSGPCLLSLHFEFCI